MPKRTNKLTLNHYITYLTNRANRYSYYMIGTATIAIPLFALLYVIWGIRLNLFSIYMQLKDDKASSSIIESMEKTLEEIKTTEEFLILLVFIFVILAIAFLIISIYENRRLEKFMRKDTPINLEELRKYFNIKRKYIEFKFWRKK